MCCYLDKQNLKGCSFFKKAGVSSAFLLSVVNLAVSPLRKAVSPPSFVVMLYKLDELFYTNTRCIFGLILVTIS
jgi:hypothetical protein